MLLVTLEVVDTTVVNIILPHLKGSFGATSDQITWSISSYMVATAIIMPLTGYLVRKVRTESGSIGWVSRFCYFFSFLWPFLESVDDGFFSPVTRRIRRSVDSNFPSFTFG